MVSDLNQTMSLDIKDASHMQYAQFNKKGYIQSCINLNSVYVLLLNFIFNKQNLQKICHIIPIEKLFRKYSNINC